MRNVALMFVLVITAFPNSFGQVQNMLSGDSAEASKLLKSAKKVAVLIELGTPVDSQGASYIPDFARAKKQISQKLTKATLEAVANPTDADIVIVVHEVNEGANKVTICLGIEWTCSRVGRFRLHRSLQFSPSTNTAEFRGL